MPKSSSMSRSVCASLVNVVDDVVVELKSVKELIPQHRTQLFNYMCLTKSPVGMLINFGRESL